MGSPTKVFGAGNARMRRRPLLIALLVVLALVAMVAVAHRPLLRAATHALVVDEPVPPADAIVVVAGGTPSREARAECSSEDGWWRRRRCSEAVLHEYLGSSPSTSTSRAGCAEADPRCRSGQ